MSTAFYTFLLLHHFGPRGFSLKSMLEGETQGTPFVVFPRGTHGSSLRGINTVWPWSPGSGRMDQDLWDSDWFTSGFRGLRFWLCCQPNFNQHWVVAQAQQIHKSTRANQVFGFLSGQELGFGALWAEKALRGWETVFGWKRGGGNLKSFDRLDHCHLSSFHCLTPSACSTQQTTATFLGSLHKGPLLFDTPQQVGPINH